MFARFVLDVPGVCRHKGNPGGLCGCNGSRKQNRASVALFSHPQDSQEIQLPFETPMGQQALRGPGASLARGTWAPSEHTTG